MFSHTHSSLSPTVHVHADQISDYRIKINMHAQFTHTQTLIIEVFYFGQMQQYQRNKWSWNAVSRCAMHLLYDNQLSAHLHLILLKTQFTWTKWIEAEKWDQEIWDTPNGETVFMW